jgi:exodeoxyribonuclease III
MKIATWNVNGIRKREPEVLAFLEREQPDVVCLQEIKAKTDQVPASLCELADYWCYWHGASGYSGVSLQVSKRLCPERPQFSHPSFDLETRVVEVAFDDLVIASIYVPNGGKDFPAKLRFLEGMALYVEEHRAAGHSLVLCGDMNVARTDADVHPKERKPGVIGQRADERALFERILSHGMSDVARQLSPDDSDLFTWWAPWRNMRQRNIGWRIDYVLASEGLASRAVSCPSFREVGTSDHAPLLATFS